MYSQTPLLELNDIKLKVITSSIPSLMTNATIVTSPLYPDSFLYKNPLFNTSSLSLCIPVALLHWIPPGICLPIRHWRRRTLRAIPITRHGGLGRCILRRGRGILHDRWRRAIRVSWRRRTVWVSWYWRSIRIPYRCRVGILLWLLFHLLGWLLLHGCHGGIIRRRSLLGG